MTAPPRISVLLPVYNAAGFLPECLESLAAQTLGDFEVVAVDDGSDDGSAELLEAWSRRDSRLRLVRRSHRGLIATLNSGLEACGGDLVARMDADDRCDPRRLELQAAVLDGPNAPDVVSCLVRHFPESSVAEGFRIYEKWLNGLTTHDDIWRERFIESPIPHPTAMLRHSTLAEAGGYRDRGWPEDYDLWLRLAQAGKRFHKVGEYLYDWREHPERLTRVDRRYAVERFLECKARFLLAGPLHEVGRLVIWGAGQTGRRLSKHLVRGGAPLQAFVDIDPRKIGRTLRGAPIASADSVPELLEGETPALLLVAVSSRGARRLIRERLTGFGLHETRDYWVAA
jgi:glycosyltransferase involved in cell wall biosynthesis